MLRCKDLTELVTDHLERQLSLAQSVSVSLHLSSCRHCGAYFGQMKSLVKLLHQLPADAGPTIVSDKLLLLFQRKHRAREVALRARKGGRQLFPS
jgi:predicted anti-sigma-YlaC factor YlaD